MKGIFDTHAHYYDKRFTAEYEGGSDALLAQILPDHVSLILNVGTNPETSRIAVEQAAKYKEMYAAVGIHPEDCHYIREPEQALKQIRELVSDPVKRLQKKILAIGEIGLDYHWQEYDGIPMDKEKQAFFFEEQMKLAEQVGLPVIIHDREAHGDCFETVLRHPRVRGVFHSYSGSGDMARELTRRGWYISFSGTLTFKNANRVRDAAMAVPRDRLLIETDAPYLAPHPHRGKLNHSGLLVHTLEVLAELWGCSPAEAAKITLQNGQKLFFDGDFVESAQK